MKTRISLLLAILLLFSGCESSDTKKSVISSNIEFSDLQNKFINEAEAYGYELEESIIDFGNVNTVLSENPSDVHIDEDGTYLAVCIREKTGPNEIVVDKGIWNELNSEEKEIVLFHELGHCVLDRDHHDQEYLSNPMSIMNHGLISSEKYTDHRSGYIKELFTEDSLDIRTSIYNYIIEIMTRSGQSTDQIEQP